MPWPATDDRDRIASCGPSFSGAGPTAADRTCLRMAAEQINEMGDFAVTVVSAAKIMPAAPKNDETGDEW